jgi:hypothetical protein
MKPDPLWAAVLICALFCLPRLIINGYTAPDSTRVFIRIPAPGLSAARVRQSIEPVVLEALGTLPDAPRIDSLARPSELLVAVEVPPGGTSSALHSRVQRRLFSAHTRLPYQAGLPSLFSEPSTVPFLTCGVEFADSVALRDPVRQQIAAEQLREQFRRAAVVRRVSIRGTADQELAVRLDQKQLVRRNISPLYISQYLQQSLFDFYSGSWPGRRRSFGIQLQSSLCSRQDLLDLRIPLPSHSGDRGWLHLRDLADIERNSVPPDHFVFGVDMRIAVFTAPDLQMWRQFTLIKELYKTMHTSAALTSWQAFGGLFFHAIVCASLLGALCCAGLLASLCFYGSARQYIIAWALLVLWHVLLHIPITYSVCIGFAAAIPTAVGLTVLQTDIDNSQSVRLCLLTAATLLVPVALAVVSVEFDGWQAAAGSIRLLLCAETATAGTLRQYTRRVRIPVSKNRPPSLRSIGLILGGGALFLPLLWLPLPAEFTAELSSNLDSERQHTHCRRIVAGFQQLYPQSQVCAVLPNLHEFSRAETAREYWNSCAHPDRLLIELLVSPLKNLLPGNSFSVPRRFPGIAPASAAAASLKISRPLDSVWLEFKPQTSAGKELHRRDLYAQIDLALTGSTVGTIPARTSLQGRLPVRLYYGSIHSQDDLRALPIFLNDTESIRLEVLCWLNPSPPDRRQ